MCRAFECRLLQGCLSGAVSDQTALKRIRGARRCFDQAQSLLAQCEVSGAERCNDAELSLSQRLHAIMTHVVDLERESDESLNAREQLMSCVNDLTERLESDFLGPETHFE